MKRWFMKGGKPSRHNDMFSTGCRRQKRYEERDGRQHEGRIICKRCHHECDSRAWQIAIVVVRELRETGGVPKHVVESGQL